MIELTFDNHNFYILNGFLDKSRGIIGRQQLINDGVVMLSNCNWVHTFGISVSIKLIFVDNELELIRTIDSIKPNNFSPWVAKATHTLECDVLFPLDRVMEMLYHLRTSNRYHKV